MGKVYWGGSSEMIDLRYRDRKYLSQYHLDAELFEAFDLIVYDIIPVRKVYMLVTNKGDKILKKIDCTIEEFKFVLEALKYIKLNFNRVVSFLNSSDNKPYVEWQGELYSVMDLVKGRECEYSNPVDLAIAAKGIGELHKASEGFKYNKYNKNICGNLISSMKRKKEEMLFFKAMSNIYENKKEFDELFLKHVDYYTSKINESILYLEKTQYLKLCSEEDKIVLCHHDLAHHNIIVDNDDAYFIDFDYAVIDLKIHDICNFSNKVIKNFAYDIEKEKLIIENYCKANTLNVRELDILFGMLIFPEDFYIISKDYYTRKKEWDEQVFVSRLNKKLNIERDRVEFLEAFKKIYIH